ncbi:MAG TPA: hypothetical protein PK954_19235 [Anaerolineales bacterium]|nr:hypothetical protein [Anaerolineales bacterium]HRF47216.1 hypothetical protein [Anaerolineales bacterium]
MPRSKWGGIASLVLIAAYIAPAFIYLTGDLRSALGPWTYNVADFLYGPIAAASLIVSFSAIRSRIGGNASQRLSWATSAAWVAAAAWVGVACLRSANRSYHLAHPDLQLEHSITVLTVWGTQIAGVIGAGWHFWGWAHVLLGAAGWTTRRIPRALSALYIAAGVPAWFVYVAPDFEGGVVLLGVVVSAWQALYLLGARAQESQASAQLVG